MCPAACAARLGARTQSAPPPRVQELHRLAYNEAFNTFGLEVGGEPVNWSVEYYDVLANTVGGGKPKMR